ncbi:MAG: GldG family protein, partial [Patescibacteria group bacterium]
MDIKKFTKKSDSSLTVIIIIGILIVVNFFSYQIFFRWDLTQNKDYSISDVSKKTVANLDDNVNIKVYFSKNLPSQFITLSQEVADILDEYENYSNGNLRVEFIDPDKLENAEQELYILGIPALQFNVLEKDNYQVVKGYLGMVVQYGDKKEAIPIIEDTNNFEYQVTLAIKKVTSDEINTIGIVSSNSSLSLETIDTAYEKILELYQVRTVDLETAESISPELKTLIVIGPKDAFSEEELKKIDNFFMQGGSLLFLVDGVKVEEGLFAIKNDINLNTLLENYGLKINSDLVLDASSGMASFSTGLFTISVNYPFWPKILKENFSKDNAAVAKLETLLLPWASSVDIISSKIDQANTVYELVKTTNQSWVQLDNYDLNPQQRFSPTGDVRQRNLAISVFGKFSSPYNQGSTESSRIIIIGDSDFISDNFLRQSPDNLTFFQNIIDSLSLDEDLINIRSKGVTERP